MNDNFCCSLVNDIKSIVDEHVPPALNLIKTCPMSQNYGVTQLLLLDYPENGEPCGKVF
jgi:hypothetical protein